jgi:hypothetical protein
LAHRSGSFRSREPPKTHLDFYGKLSFSKISLRVGPVNGILEKHHATK